MIGDEQQPQPKKPFGEFVRELYLSRGLNRNSFAKKIGAAYTTVLDWEHRGAIPKADKLEAIRNELQLDTSEAETLFLATIQQKRRAEARRTKPHVKQGAIPVSLEARQQSPSSLSDNEQAARASEALAKLNHHFSPAFIPGRHSIPDAYLVMSLVAALRDDVFASLDEAQGINLASGLLEAAAAVRADGEEISMTSLTMHLLKLAAVAKKNPPAQ